MLNWWWIILGFVLTSLLISLIRESVPSPGRRLAIFILMSAWMGVLALAITVGSD